MGFRASEQVSKSFPQRHSLAPVCWPRNSAATSSKGAHLGGSSPRAHANGPLQTVSSLLLVGEASREVRGVKASWQGANWLAAKCTMHSAPCADFAQLGAPIWPASSLIWVPLVRALDEGPQTVSGVAQVARLETASSAGWLESATLEPAARSRSPQGAGWKRARAARRLD